MATAALLTGVLIAATPGAAQTAEVVVTPTPSPQAPDFPATDRAIRAQRHLEALIAGRLSTSDLSPQQLQDVIDFDRMVRGRIADRDTRSFSQRCVDEEVRRNNGNPSRLAWEVIRLKCR
ncbi:MAG: hypothetical protein ACKO01_09280 [Erythrobacter sp.]